MNPHNHSGPGHDHTDVDWAVMADQLENVGELQLPVLHQTATHLRERLDPEKKVRRILDIGIGRPGLQTRLDGVRERWFEIMRAELPGSTTVVEDWPAMLTRAGLSDVANAHVRVCGPHRHLTTELRESPEKGAHDEDHQYRTR